VIETFKYLTLILILKKLMKLIEGWIVGFWNFFGLFFWNDGQFFCLWIKYWLAWLIGENVSEMSEPSKLVFHSGEGWKFWHFNRRENTNKLKQILSLHVLMIFEWQTRVVSMSRGSKKHGINERFSVVFDTLCVFS
jgi:hypothetical protein